MISTDVLNLNATPQESILALSPFIHTFVQKFLEEKEFIEELCSALGSPLNIVFPQLISKNLESFQNIFSKHGLHGRVYFAHKANQSCSLIRQLATNSAFVDVSSVNELRHALGNGFEGSRIEATGPKNADFLLLAILHGVTISIDSICELNQVLSIRHELNIGSPTKVLLRLCGFKAAHSRFLNKSSRFGIPLFEFDDALDILCNSRDELTFLGLAFHLDTVSPLERAVAIENCWQLFERALARDLEPRVLNIGGGYKVNYLASQQEWNEYTTALKEAVLGTRNPLSWQENGFGMAADKGKLRGNFNSYNFYDEVTGPNYLDELLSQRFPGLNDTTAGALLRDNMIELWIEPGRSLLNQVGCTVARVISVRKSSRGDDIIGLNMKRQDISFLDQEIFIDPVILYKESPKASDSQCAVFFSGNLCLESDMVYRHKTYLSKLPQVGDLVVFVNTAGYFMDFSATNSIMQPIANKIAIWEKDDQGFKWSMDSLYSPIQIAQG